MDKNCSFCSEINNIKNNNFYEKYLKKEFEKEHLNSRIVWKTSNFIIIPMVGPLVEEYLLIVPKFHCLSIAQLPKEQFEELIKIKQILRNVMLKIYGKIVFYEHGAISCYLKGGSCSDHAHLHAVAVNVDVKEKFSTFGYSLVKMRNFNDIVVQQEKSMPYLYYENQQGEMYICDAPIVESQFIRKLIGVEINNLSRLLWYENINYSWMINIIKKLKPILEKEKLE